MTSAPGVAAGHRDPLGERGRRPVRRSRRPGPATLLVLTGGALLVVLQRVQVASAPVVALVAVAPVLALAPAAVTVVSLGRRRWWTAAAGLVLLAALGSVRGPFLAASPASSPATAGARMTVMTVNVDRGGADPADLVRVVRDRHVDVLAVQELTPYAVDRLRSAGLDALLPNRVLEPGDGPAGTGLWSRYPLRANSSRAGLFFRVANAQVTVPAAGGAGVQLLVASAHPLAPQAGGPAWASDQRTLARWIGAHDGPVVLAGDLNATWDHPGWREILRTGLQDAAAQTRRWWQPTWPSNSVVPPLVAIDHVLTGGGLRATSLDSVRVAGTDHRALVATVTG